MRPAQGCSSRLVITCQQLNTEQAAGGSTACWPAAKQSLSAEAYKRQQGALQQVPAHIQRTCHMQRNKVVLCAHVIPGCSINKGLEPRQLVPPPPAATLAQSNSARTSTDSTRRVSACGWREACSDMSDVHIASCSRVTPPRAICHCATCSMQNDTFNEARACSSMCMPRPSLACRWV